MSKQTIALLAMLVVANLGMLLTYWQGEQDGHAAALAQQPHNGTWDLDKNHHRYMISMGTVRLFCNSYTVSENGTLYFTDDNGQKNSVRIAAVTIEERL